MFCPKCGKEYRKDIYICAKCRVTLVPELLEDRTNESQKFAEFEEFLLTPSSGDMALIKSLLDNEGIICHFRGEFFSSEHRYVQPVRLTVHTDQVEEVKEILKSLNIAYNVR